MTRSEEIRIILYRWGRSLRPAGDSGASMLTMSDIEELHGELVTLPRHDKPFPAGRICRLFRKIRSGRGEIR